MQKVNLQELVLSCIESSDAQQRRIFRRMMHATTRNKEKTRNRPKKHCFGKRKKKNPRRAAFAAFTESLPLELSSKATQQELISEHRRTFYTWIDSDPAQIWRVYSQAFDLSTVQSSGDSSSISPSSTLSFCPS